MISISKYINICLNIDKLILILFYISIFLLPTNLFFVWRIPESYIQGHFIDYLAPKLYLQQIVLAGLFVVWGAKSWKATRGKTSPLSVFWVSLAKIPLSLRLAGGISIFSLLFALFRADWGLASLLCNFLTGPLLLALFLWKEADFRKNHLAPALLGAVFFQSVVALWQSLTQNSLAGYWFFGEPDLSLLEVVTSSLPGAVQKLPYGTTPHPNILAGWLVLGISALVWIRRKSTFSLWKESLFVLAGSLFLWVLLLTESWTAWVSLLLLLGFYATRRWIRLLFSEIPSGKIQRVLLVSFFIAVQGMMLFLPRFLEKSSLSSSLVAPNSLTRRSDLQQTSLSLIQQNPTGSGFRSMFQYIYNSEMTYEGGRFLQPPHNTLILFTTALGFWVLIVIILFLVKEHNVYSITSLLLLSILPIFCLDHYFFSTISGQFMAAILIRFFHNIISEKYPR